MTNQNSVSKYSKWEEFSHNIVDFQEAYQLMLVWESSETHKLGIFRFYLFTEHLTNGDEVFTEMTE